MQITSDLIEQLLFYKFHSTLRFTQDSPVYPDVWIEFFNERDHKPAHRVDVILTPHRQSSAADMFKILSEQLALKNGENDPTSWRMASNGDSVAACLTLEELVMIALPLTNWWQNYLWKKDKPTPDQEWLLELVGAISLAIDPTLDRTKKPMKDKLEFFRSIFHLRFPKLVDKKQTAKPVVLWSVNRNRPAGITMERSVPATKADSGRKLFDVDGTGISWAVLDTGINANHPAFRKLNPDTMKPYDDAMGNKNDKLSNQTRIVATYDFNRFRNLLSEIHAGKNVDHKSLKTKQKMKVSNIAVTSDKDDKSLAADDIDKYIQEMLRDLQSGRMLDWTVISPLLRIPHNNSEYIPPVHTHGTHVAGILGAGLEKKGTQKAMLGMCPGISLYDIRVLDANGAGDEFNILAAIQFVRWMNAQKDGILIHGTNMSFSMIHAVASYACGQTPVCEAAERLVSEGTVVVAAAGNLGQALYADKKGGSSQGFRMVNITDPGNAEEIITVGSTHRDRPHAYGVSYFSSKGPTGDGRMKPDLVAPGEKIVSLSGDNGTQRMDGTSMAAPHVSGAAALLLAKHRELIGRPRKVKAILCSTATDLGREKYFQGSGMVDVLRAIQSV